MLLQSTRRVLQSFGMQQFKAQFWSINQHVMFMLHSKQLSRLDLQQLKKEFKEKAE